MGIDLRVYSVCLTRLLHHIDVKSTHEKLTKTSCVAFGNSCRESLKRLRSDNMAKSFGHYFAQGPKESKFLAFASRLCSLKGTDRWSECMIEQWIGAGTSLTPE